MFNTFDEYLDFCASLIKENTNTYTLLKKSSLYLYNSKYYLCINISSKKISLFNHIHYSIIEFASHINDPLLFERKLKEYGKIIFKTNAINKCLIYFK